MEVAGGVGVMTGPGVSLGEGRSQGMKDSSLREEVREPGFEKLISMETDVTKNHGRSGTGSEPRPMTITDAVACSGRVGGDMAYQRDTHTRRLLGGGRPMVFKGTEEPGTPTPWRMRGEEQPQW